MSYSKLVAQTYDDLPSQEPAHLVEIPPLPVGWTIETSYALEEASSCSDLPFRTFENPDSLRLVAGLEWAWTSINERCDIYRLERRRQHWALWNDLPTSWFGGEQCYGLAAWAPWIDLDERSVAIHLLKASLASEVRDFYAERYHFIRDCDLLSVSDIIAIADQVFD